MAVTETLNEYSQTQSTNTPAGTDSVGTDLDDHLRNIKWNVRAAADWPVQTAKTTAYTTAAADIHTVISVDATATNTILISLLSAVTVGDGYTIAVSKDSTNGSVLVNDTAGATINGTATIGVRGSFSTMVLTSDGTKWRAVGNGVVPGTFGASLMETETAGAAALAVFPSLSGITAGAAVVAVSGSDDLVSAGFTLEEQIPTGTVCIFWQQTKPDLWTKRTDGAGDWVVGVDVPGGWGATGASGSWTISGLTNAGVELTKAQIPSHVHTSTGITPSSDRVGGGSNIGITATTTPDTGDGTADDLSGGSAGDGEPHTHTPSSDGTWRPLMLHCLRAYKTAPVALP